MEPQRVDESSINYSLCFDGNNYVHRKERMKFFLKMQQELLEYSEIWLVASRMLVNKNERSIIETKPK